MATTRSPKLARIECWCGKLKPGSTDQCSCPQTGRSIYLDRTFLQENVSECSLKAKSCGGACSTSWQGLYVDNRDVPELESARRNNSSESPVLSSSEHVSIRGQDTSSTVTLGRDAETSFLRSGPDSLASNNIAEEDASSSGNEGLGPARAHCWEDNQTQNKLQKKSLYGKHRPERQSRRHRQDLLSPSSSKSKMNVGSQAEKSNQTLISSLEHAIALLGLSLGDASQLEGIDSLVTSKLESEAHRATPELEIASETSNELSHGTDLTRNRAYANAPQTQLNFPTPCTMQSTYNDPFISPLATEQEYRSTITGSFQAVSVFMEAILCISSCADANTVSGLLQIIFMEVIVHKYRKEVWTRHTLSAGGHQR